jgi:hypothetical protein
MLECGRRATASNADRFSLVFLNGVFPAMHSRSGHVATRFTGAVAFVVSLPANLWAGMPAVTLSDVARMRLSTISFFCLGFLLAAQVTRWASGTRTRNAPPTDKRIHRTRLVRHAKPSVVGKIADRRQLSTSNRPRNSRFLSSAVADGNWAAGDLGDGWRQAPKED